MSDLVEAKRAMRRAVRERALAMDEGARRHEGATLTALVLEALERDRPTTILLYLTAFPEEAPTAPLVDWALAEGRRLALPRVVRGERRLSLHLVRDLANDLVPGPLGLTEPRERLPQVGPEEVDWALVPGVAFDPRGQRLGRGAGHYDRLLPATRPEAPRWAMAHDCQWVEAVPTDPWDFALSGTFTTRGAVPALV